MAVAPENQYEFLTLINDPCILMPRIVKAMWTNTARTFRGTEPVTLGLSHWYILQENPDGLADHKLTFAKFLY